MTLTQCSNDFPWLCFVWSKATRPQCLALPAIAYWKVCPGSRLKDAWLRSSPRFLVSSSVHHYHGSRLIIIVPSPYTCYLCQGGYVFEDLGGYLIHFGEFFIYHFFCFVVVYRLALVQAWGAADPQGFMEVSSFCAVWINKIRGYADFQFCHFEQLQGLCFLSVVGQFFFSLFPPVLRTSPWP